MSDWDQQLKTTEDSIRVQLRLAGLLTRIEVDPGTADRYLIVICKDGIEFPYHWQDGAWSANDDGLEADFLGSTIDLVRFVYDKKWLPVDQPVDWKPWHEWTDDDREEERQLIRLLRKNEYPAQSACFYGTYELHISIRLQNENEVSYHWQSGYWQYQEQGNRIYVNGTVEELIDFLKEKKWTVPEWQIAALRRENEKRDQFEGYVYIIGIEGRPELKIGITTRSPMDRIREWQTGHPERYIVHASFPTGNLQETESIIHKKLYSFRKRGEWFEIDLEEAKIVVKDIISSNSGFIKQKLL